MANQSQTRLGALERDRKRLVDSLVASGHTRPAAETVAFAFFNKRVKAEETRLERAKVSLERTKNQQDRNARFSQPKRLAERRAAVAALRTDELERQAAWEQAKAEQARGARSPADPLAPEERQLLHQLIEVVRAAGAQPPPVGDSSDILAFLDAFEARLDEARATSAKLGPRGVAGRYNEAVNRLLHASDQLAPGED
jgi:hypothetical protein